MDGAAIHEVQTLSVRTDACASARFTLGIAISYFMRMMSASLMSKV